MKGLLRRKQRKSKERKDKVIQECLGTLVSSVAMIFSFSPVMALIFLHPEGREGELESFAIFFLCGERSPLCLSRVAPSISGGVYVRRVGVGAEVLQFGCSSL